MQAVIKTGGKQYLVKEGQKLKVEKLSNKAGEEITFEAMLIAGDKGENVKVGTPTVKDAKVTAEIVEQGRAKKVSVIKYKPKSRYRRNVGHRQPFTQIKILKIEG